MSGTASARNEWARQQARRKAYRVPPGAEGRTDGGLGISHQGIETALAIKESYKTGSPICVPGEDGHILIPEHLLNPNLNLQTIDDPLPLAVMATQDPEPPMAVAAAARLTPLANSTRLVSGLYTMVGETTRHPMVRSAVEMVTENAFSPRAIAHVRRHAARYVVRTRSQYTAALRQNLVALMEGVITPREFVKEFFELTEAGNLRHDVRKKLVLSLLVSPAIRPSIKFLVLENFERLPRAVQVAIVSGVLQAEPTRHSAAIKDELRWIVAHEWKTDLRASGEVH